MDLQKYKICPECGKQNPPSLIECKYCEADLTGVKVFDPTAVEISENPSTAAPSVQNSTALVRICECGAKNAPQARKCKVCGEDISDIIPIEVVTEEKKLFSYTLKTLDGTYSVTISEPLITVGREADLKEYLQNKPYVSRNHARFTIVAEKVFIENLSLTNKTFLNNEELPNGTPTALKNGDEIGLGGKVVDGSRQDKAAYFIFSITS